MTGLMTIERKDPETSPLALQSTQAGDIRIGPIFAIPDVLKARGVNPQLAFARADVDLRLFDDPDNRLALEAVGRLLDACAVLTGCAHFGLLVGERFSLAGFGPIGDLMRHSATTGDALRVMLRHLHLHDRSAALILLATEKSYSILGYSMLRHGVPGANHIHDTALAIGYKILTALCGPLFVPLRVQFSYSCPKSPAPYSRMFRCNLVFNADVTGICIENSLLARLIDGADPTLRLEFEKAVLVAEASYPAAFGERLERALHQIILSGDVSSETICRQFAISERSLRRRLAEEGRNLQQVINQTRYEVARHLLQNTDMPVSKIAAALHYADANIFSRAFRNWAGLSPRQWRALDREEDAKTTLQS